MHQIVILFFSGVIVMVVLEWGLRAYFACSRHDKYFVHPPALHKAYGPMLGLVSGKTGTIHFQTNAYGIRGDEFREDQAYRILAIGGSTTECQFLDQEKTWQAVLQKKLNRPHAQKVWVGNAGKSGLCCREFYMHMKYLLPQYPQIDTIVVLTGVNNFLRPLIEADRYDPCFWDHYEYWEDRLIRGAFARMPYFRKKFRFRPGYYDETAVGYLVKRFHYRYLQRTLYRDKREGLLILRNDRNRASKLDTLPDLTAGLQEYMHNLHAMIDLAAASSVRIVFMTQPTLWKKNMTEQEECLLWNGWAGSRKAGRYYTAEALLSGMEQYNDKLKKVCRARKVECIDLGAVLPKDASVLYDDCHFTEYGARLAANVIYRHLIRREPFLKGTTLQLARGTRHSLPGPRARHVPAASPLCGLTMSIFPCFERTRPAISIYADARCPYPHLSPAWDTIRSKGVPPWKRNSSPRLSP